MSIDNRETTAFIDKEETRQRGPGETRQVEHIRTIRRGQRQKGKKPGEKGKKNMSHWK